MRSASFNIACFWARKIQIEISSCNIDDFLVEKIQAPTPQLQHSAFSPPENTSLCIFLISLRHILKLEEGFDIFLEFFCCMLQLAAGVCIFLISPRYILQLEDSDCIFLIFLRHMLQMSVTGAKKEKKYFTEQEVK